MNIAQLQYFTAAVRERSYSLAAKELFITPQAVSKAISELEKELQIALIVRERKDVVPSSFGELFNIYAAEVVENFADLSLLAQLYHEKAEYEGSLEVAVASCGLRGSVSRHIDLDVLKERYPHVKITAFFHESGSCLSALEEDVVDAAIILGRTQKQGFYSIKLALLAPMVALSKQHPLANRESIALGELGSSRIAQPNDLRFFYSVLSKQLTTHGVDPRFVIVPPLLQEHQDFFDAGDGVMFVTGDSDFERMHSGVCIKPLHEKSRFLVPVCLVYKKANDNPATAWLANCLTKNNGKPLTEATKAAR